MKQTGLKPGLENSLNLTSYSLFEQGLEAFQPDSIRNGSIFNLDEGDISLLNALNINSKPKNGQKTPTNNYPPQKFQVSNTLKDIDDLLTRLKPTKEIQPISENNQPILQDYYSRGANEKNSKNNVLEYENNAWQNNQILPQTTNFNNNNLQYPSTSRPQPQDIYNGNQYDNTNRQQPENVYQPPPIKSQRSSKDIPPPQNTYYQPQMNIPRSTPQVSDFLGGTPQDSVRVPLNTNYYQQPPLNNPLRNQEIPTRQQENYYPSNKNFSGQTPYEYSNGKNVGIQPRNQEIPKKSENYYPSNDNYSGQKQYEYNNGINEIPLKNQEIPRQQENYYDNKSSGQKPFEITNGRNDNYYLSKPRETYTAASQEKYYQSYQKPQETNKDYYQTPGQQEEKYYDMQMNKEIYYKSASKTTQSQTEKNTYFNNSQDTQ